MERKAHLAGPSGRTGFSSQQIPCPERHLRHHFQSTMSFLAWPYVERHRRGSGHPQNKTSVKFTLAIAPLLESEEREILTGAGGPIEHNVRLRTRSICSMAIRTAIAEPRATPSKWTFSMFNASRKRKMSRVTCQSVCQNLSHTHNKHNETVSSIGWSRIIHLVKVVFFIVQRDLSASMVMVIQHNLHIPLAMRTVQRSAMRFQFRNVEGSDSRGCIFLLVPRLYTEERRMSGQKMWDARGVLSV
jgi:hypothetical protein